VDGDALMAAAFVSVIKNHQFTRTEGHIPQRDALDMFWDTFGQNLDSDVTV
jgi:hypothetical protein